VGWTRRTNLVAEVLMQRFGWKTSMGRTGWEKQDRILQWIRQGQTVTNTRQGPMVDFCDDGYEPFQFHNRNL
jgi:hypothetical protein